jgi:predicted membrane protein
MKMAPGFFWGIVLILIGLSIIFRIAFGISLFRIIVAVVIIAIGIRILVGHHGIFSFRTSNNDVLFGEHTYTEAPKRDTEYNTIFSNGVYDFRNVTFENNKPIKIKVNTIFGRSVIKVNRDTPVKVKADAVFGSATMPNGNSVAFGTNYHTSENFNDSTSYLYIKADVVFGAVEIRSY